MATGSPFDPVNILGEDKKYVIAECNNVRRLYTMAETYWLGINLPWSGLWCDIGRSKDDDGWYDCSRSEAFERSSPSAQGSCGFLIAAVRG